MFKFAKTQEKKIDKIITRRIDDRLERKLPKSHLIQKLLEVWMDIETFLRKKYEREQRKMVAGK